MAVTHSALSTEEHAQRLADYLPGGRLFRAKNLNDSNLRKLLRGIAHEMRTSEGYINDFLDEIAPSITPYFIDEWERAVGIPDSCFSGAGSADERRLDIIIKLASLGVQTVDDFTALGDLLGFSITVSSGTSHIIFPLTFPVLMFATEKEARFTIVVDFTDADASRFPLTFPFTFGSAGIAKLECLLQRLKPANCDLIFRQV